MSLLPKFLRRRIHEYMLFTWITCCKYIQPGATLDQAINSFYRRFKIDPEKFPVRNAIKIFSRMNEEFDEIEKEVNEEFKIKK